MPKGATLPAPETAVIPQPLSSDEFMALLAESGMINQPSAGDFHRMTLSNGLLVVDQGTDKEESFPPTRGGGPAFLARIVKPPVYMNVFYCNENEERGAFDARKVGRGDLNGKFCKKYDDPAEQADDQYANLDAYEAIAAHTQTRGKFRADIQLQIVPESGTLTGEEPVYTLSLSTTSALDWRGTAANQQGGIVQDKNFIVQLGEFAMKQAIEEGGDKAAIQMAVLNAMQALRLGNVVAAVYIRAASNQDKSMTWSVVSFQPVFIDGTEEVPALPDPTTVGPEQDGDDIPL